MQLVELQKKAAQAIINIFETGSVRGNYADVTLLRGDSGQLTYGRSQTTLASGNLYLLIKSYCERSDGAYAEGMIPFLDRLEACASSLNHDMTFRGMLRDAGDDPVMHDVQDAFFDRIYWDPAIRSADALGVSSALGAAIVYDGTVHGSWARIRDRTRKSFGELRDLGEEKWMAHYVDQRRDWLATHPNPLLHKTVYRMDAFKAIIHGGNWKLSLPLSVRGLAISPDSISILTPVKVSAEGTPRRMLRLKDPPLSGPDVTWLQERLTRGGYHVEATGTFDAATDKAVRSFQEAQDLAPDGVVGGVTRTALEDIAVTVPMRGAVADEPMPAIVSDSAALTVTAPVIVVDQDATPSTTPSTMPASASDWATDIKKHVTNEVHAGVETIRNTVIAGQQHVETVLTGRPAARGASTEVTQYHLPSISSVLKGRPVLAATASAAILAFTEARDAIAWVQAGPWNSHAPVPTPGPATTQVPQSGDDLMRFFTQGYQYIHGLAAALPNEWVFRIRIVAFLLILYALYRIGRRHLDIRKLEKDIVKARQIEAEVNQVLR